jgi:hypothetical protein
LFPSFPFPPLFPISYRLSLDNLSLPLTLSSSPFGSPSFLPPSRCWDSARQLHVHFVLSQLLTTHLPPYLFHIHKPLIPRKRSFALRTPVQSEYLLPVTVRPYHRLSPSKGSFADRWTSSGGLSREISGNNRDLRNTIGHTNLFTSELNIWYHVGRKDIHR